MRGRRGGPPVAMDRQGRGERRPEHGAGHGAKLRLPDGRASHSGRPSRERRQQRQQKS